VYSSVKSVFMVVNKGKAVLAFVIKGVYRGTRDRKYKLYKVSKYTH